LAELILEDKLNENNIVYIKEKNDKIEFEILKN